MTSESLDTARELPELPAQRVAGPLLFSAGLHAIVLLLFARTTFSVSTEENPAERPSIRVALVERPQPIEAEPPPPAVERIPEPVEAPEPTEPETIDVARAEPAPAEPPPLREDETTGVAPAETAATFQPWTPARIRAAVQASSSELRGRLTEQWMEDCILETKERNTRDCEQQRQQQEYLSPNAETGRSAGANAFAGVRRADQQWLLAEQFKKDNETHRGLVDADGVLGELATTRYYMNRDYIIYLSGNRVNGNHNDMINFAMQNFSADVLGGPKLLLNGDIRFECRSKKIEYRPNLATPSVAYGNVVPCTYEFTGFTIERPDPDPNEFRVVPTIFGSQR